MASNIGAGGCAVTIGQSVLIDEDTKTNPNVIEKDIRGTPMGKRPLSIFLAVKKRFHNMLALVIVSVRNRILKIIDSTLQYLRLKQKPAIGNGQRQICTLIPKDFEFWFLYYLGKSHPITVHLDLIKFEMELKEISAGIYPKEKSELLTIITTDNFDFEVLANQLNKVLPAGTDVVYKGKESMDISALILAVLELFDYNHNILNAESIQNHIRTFRENCLSIVSNVTYQENIHQENASSTFNVYAVKNHLVNIEIRHDRNSMWSSISHSLVGDYTMTKSLRLLTAYTLMHNYETFSEALKNQINKFTPTFLTPEGLIETSLNRRLSGEDFHLMALSLALKRPIYSYGSLIAITESASLSYEQFRPKYEKRCFDRHFKCIGDANDQNNEPILLYCDGYRHHSSVLKRSDCVKPLVPLVQIIDVLFNGELSVDDEQLDELVKFDKYLREKYRYCYWN